MSVNNALKEKLAPQYGVFLGQLGVILGWPRNTLLLWKLRVY
jgi:hypothetical protein